MGSASAGTCKFWSAPFFSSMSPCPRIPEHLMQVPDLIDVALPVLFGGRWHILQTSAQVSIKKKTFGHIFRAPLGLWKGLAEADLGNPGQKIRCTKIVGTNWACAVLFFPALTERNRWLRGLDCHAISLATTCRLSTQARHLTAPLPEISFWWVQCALPLCLLASRTYEKRQGKILSASKITSRSWGKGWGQKISILRPPLADL